MYNDPVCRDKPNWANLVKNMLCSYGFGEAWAYQAIGNDRIFIELFKQRISDIYKQDWRAVLSNTSKARTYVLFKESLSPSHYLELFSQKHRITLSRFFTHNHQLNVEAGSWQRPKISYSQRICPYCKDDLEDEFHFVLKCKLYNDLRKQYIKAYYRIRPSVYKFIQLCQSSKKSDLNNLAKFILSATNVRNSFMYDTTAPPP